MEPFDRHNSLTDRLAFLKSVPLFRCLDDADLTRLLKEFNPVAYRKNTMLFWQDDPSDKLYLVQKGKVRIFKLSAAGQETSINIFSTGDLIGEFGIIDLESRSANAKTITSCVIWEISGPLFMRFMYEIPGLAVAMARLVVQKARWTAAYVETVVQYDAAGRLLHILLLYNAQFGEELEAGRRYRIELGLTQDDLASLVGARREWVNRLLKDWREQKLLEYKSGVMLIHDLRLMEQERDQRLEGALFDPR
ncbi:MAG: Crp/Fnr family transcriptional regulator [Herpetosiphonaceae bacterium]|nr:Crp/Fnr family transcriptional regulator [Herpetosiphonaceae bacterium]